MDEKFTVEIQERISNYLDTIESTANTAGEFMVDQTPLVVQEYLSWVFYSSLAFVIISIIGIVACSYAMKKCVVLISDPKCDDFKESISFVVLIGSFSVIIPSVMTLFYKTLDLIQVIVAPRLVLLDKVAKLIN